MRTLQQPSQYTDVTSDKVVVVAYPNPTIHKMEDSPRFHFPTKPQKISKEKAMRAIVPISAETIKSCDGVLIGTADPRDLR